MIRYLTRSAAIIHIIQNYTIEVKWCGWIVPLDGMEEYSDTAMSYKVSICHDKCLEAIHNGKIRISKHGMKLRLAE
jgi:hypothetical protein